MKKLSLILALTLTTATAQANAVLWSAGGAVIGALYAVVTQLKTKHEPDHDSRKNFLKRLAWSVTTGSACGFVARRVKSWLVPQSTEDEHQNEENKFDQKHKKKKNKGDNNQSNHNKKQELKTHKDNGYDKNNYNTNQTVLVSCCEPEKFNPTQNKDNRLDERQVDVLRCIHNNGDIRQNPLPVNLDFIVNLETNETPLFLAVKRKSFNTVKSLLAQGANPHAKNVDGKTPFILAVQQRIANRGLSDIFIKEGTIIDEYTVLYFLKNYNLNHPLTQSSLLFLAEKGAPQGLFTTRNESGRTLIEEAEKQKLDQDGISFLKIQHEVH